MTGYYPRDGPYIAAGASGSSRVRPLGLVVLPSGRRKNGIGISEELPAWRSIAWNVAFLGVEACLIGWAHFVVGVSWSTIGAGLATVVVLGIALITYTVKVRTRKTIRRHRELLQSYLTAQAAAHDQYPQVQPVQAATPDPDEAVDRQSTPHLVAPSLTAETSRVSRARRR